MEAKDLIFSIVMVVSAFVLTFRWIGQYGMGDAVVVLSAMVLVGALAAMILCVNVRLRAIDDKIDAKERSLRVNIQSVEDDVERRLNMMVNRVNEAMEEFSRRAYR
ncbi:MAG: hypothetical protein QMC85_00465 [Methanocellales archaeon]|nr:hypothetical protein [Methanocellales archaeon]MDI6902753.1 hypothetical protein [Methanocellales archaeon]